MARYGDNGGVLPTDLSNFDQQVLLRLSSGSVLDEINNFPGGWRDASGGDGVIDKRGEKPHPSCY